MKQEKLVDTALREVDVLNQELLLYTSCEMERLRETLRENAIGNEHMRVCDYVDMCVMLANI